MKILHFTSLFPNSEQPSHGIFVERRLLELVASGGVEARVMAPVPWFPFSHPRFGRYAALARVPKQELRGGLAVCHPRFPVIPKVGMTLAPWLLAQAVQGAVERLIGEGFDFDLIDAHYFYPDGVAAVLLGRHFNKPVVITARGSDINLIPRHALPRRWIRWAAGQAAGLVANCRALAEAMVELGIERQRIQVLRNGVDLKMFFPLDRQQERGRLGVEGRVLLSVGHLITRKGHDLVIRALSLLPDVQLLIVGDGEERAALLALAEREGVAQRVRFLGVLPPHEVCRVMNAADCLLLASSREGWANVLLESMACGTPVLATAVWGTPEVVAWPGGRLVMERTPHALAEGVRALFADPPRREAVRRYAENFSWAETTQGQRALFARIMGREE